MEKYSIPCDFKPCDASPVIDIGPLLLPTAYEPYVPGAVLTSGDRITIDKQILKIDTLEVEDDVYLELDLNNDFDYYVIVVNKLVVNKQNKEEPDVIFRWYYDNMEDLYAKLKGTRGANASQPGHPGAHGLPGGTGGKGKSRHSPASFIFFNDVKFNNNTRAKHFSFDFQLQGIPGGQGGQGGNGSNGTKGKKGRDGRPGRLLRGCRRGKNGGPGGNPGRGGRGGDGGCGGNGPEVMIYYIDEKFNKILDESKYNVDGAFPIFNPDGGPGGWGNPGRPGKEGPGGDGGSRGGNCRGGHDGRAGLPKQGTNEWSSWHMGHGLPGTYGLAGGFDFDPIDDGVLKIVFNDPNATTNTDENE